jgi:methyl-accepting chemotaxis protein
MQSLLSRVSLRIQIGLLVVLAGLVIVGSALIQLNSRHQVDVSLDTARIQQALLDRVSDLDVGLLESRRHEKNFLLRHDALSQKEHAQAIIAMTTALDGMTALLPPDQSDRQALIRSVRDGVTRYVDGFRSMVALQIKAGLTPSDGLLGEMHGAALKVEEAIRRSDQPRLAVQFLLLRRTESEALAKPNQDLRGQWAERSADFQRAVEGADLNAAARAGLLDRLEGYRAAFTTAADTLQAVRSAEKTMIEAHRAVLEPSLNALAKRARSDMETARNAADRIGLRARMTANGIEIGGFAVVVVVGWLLAHSIYRPLNDMTRVMHRLAEGGTDIAIPAQDRRDEVGDMARSVQVFRSTMAEAERLRRTNEDDRRQAEHDRAATILAMADDFEASVKTKVAEVDLASSGIRNTAQAMASRSERSGSRSLDVGEAARITNERAAGAAEATRQLAFAVNEIAKQVAHSTEIARQTVEDVNATATRMEQLSGSVQSIGEIVLLINNIAAQTRMLALNATIEAARAGEAGKGFAVVADEVKHLAGKTAEATEEISRQVTEVQDSSRQMASSISGVVDIIRTLDEISAAIAGAVQEQEAATHEIADNIEEVAHQADEVSRSVADLSKSSAQTCAGTIRVIWSARSLADVVDSLTGETDGFLGRVRSQDRQGA